MDEGKKRKHNLKLTDKEFAKRKAKGLCYNCEEYTPRHRCKKELYIVIASKVSEDFNYLESDSYLFAHEDESRLVVAYISLRSIIGRLFDTRAADNFIRHSLAIEAELILTATPPYAVRLRDGRKTQGHYILCNDSLII